MFDAVLFLFALVVLCLVIATAPGTPDRAVIWKMIVGTITIVSVVCTENLKPDYSGDEVRQG